MTESAQPPVPPVPPNNLKLVGEALQTILETLGSKKAMTMVFGNAAFLSAASELLAKHPELSMTCVIAAACITCTYIITQGYVDAHKK
jgi:hypothetical protein